MEEDKEDLESKFQSLIESQSVAHEAFKKEMDAINSQIEALEEQKQKIADKYGFPYKLDKWYTYMPEKFIENFGEFINGSNYFSYLEELQYLFDMSRHLYQGREWGERFSAGINGWEPSSC